jgi:glucose 1-dehydrogenase
MCPNRRFRMARYWCAPWRWVCAPPTAKSSWEPTAPLPPASNSDGSSLAGLAPDILIECTGAPAVIRSCFGAIAPAGIVCLTGVTEPGKMLDLDIGGVNRAMVLNNEAVFGTVNANHRHYEMAAEALARADKTWLGRLITRRVPLERWNEALERRHDDIKVIIEFAH